jgi:hypothetical protein
MRACVFCVFAFLFCAALTAGEAKPYQLESALVRNEHTLTLGVVLKATGSSTINQEAPVVLEVQPSEGVAFARTRFARADAKVSTQREVRFEISATAKYGSPRVSGTLVFYLCSAKDCRKIEEHFSSFCHSVLDTESKVNRSSSLPVSLGRVSNK